MADATLGGAGAQGEAGGHGSAREEERRQLRIALDAAGLGSWRHDLRTGVVRLDARGQQHYGLPRAEVEISDVVARVHPDDRGRLADEMAAVLGPSGSGRHVTEYRVLNPAGDYRLLRVHVRVEFEGAGETRHPVLGYGTTQDVTDARRAERQLAEQAQLLRDVGEIAQIGGWHFDTATGEGNWTDETLRIHGITGQPDSAAMGLDRFPGEARARIEAALHQAITEGTPYDLELPFVSVGGEEKWVRAVCRPVIEQGRVVRLRGTLQDVTAHKHLEEQLRQSHKLEAIGQLAGGVAHDFNNLLTVITGNVEMLEEMVHGRSAASDLLLEIKAAAERAATLTRQLLAFGRKTMLQPKAIDVDAALLRTERMLRRVIGEDVAISTVTRAGGARILIDEGQFEQILLNLVVNARDAMPGGGRLTIATSVEAGDGPSHPSWIRLTVTDTGVGMTTEVQRHMFEPFFTTKPLGQGTGLGLATVFGIVSQCQGRIAVKSTPGTGSSFVLDFPSTVEPGEVTATPAPAARGAETVMLVEDDATVRRLVARALTNRGYRVVDAPGPQEALAVIDRLPAFDLLVTDVVMPSMSGRTLANVLRERRPGLPVLFMSGYSQAELDRQGLGPHEALLKKPFSGSDLALAVRRLLDGG